VGLPVHFLSNTKEIETLVEKETKIMFTDITLNMKIEKKLSDIRNSKMQYLPEFYKNMSYRNSISISCC